MRRYAWVRTEWASGLVLLAALVGVSGCDYWPPALQAQIEQVRAELQATAAERAKLETKLNEATRLLNETTKAKDELQARVQELTRVGQEQAVKIANLEQALAAERDKMAKLMKPSKKTAPVKSSAKSASKAPMKKKIGSASAKKRTS